LPTAPGAPPGHNTIIRADPLGGLIFIAAGLGAVFAAPGGDAANSIPPADAEEIRPATSKKDSFMESPEYTRQPSPRPFFVTDEVELWHDLSVFSALLGEDTRKSVFRRRSSHEYTASFLLTSS
jgi:hypothetical protein